MRWNDPPITEGSLLISDWCCISYESMVECYNKLEVVSMEKDIKESIIKFCEENSPFPVKGSKALKDIKAFLRTNGYSINNIRTFFLQPEKHLFLTS